MLMKPFEFSILLLGLTLSACASTQSGERATNQTLPLPEPMQWRDEGLTASSIRFNAPSERHSYHFTDDFSGAKVHGSGRYRYRMVLQDPNTPAKPLRMQDYALSHDEIDLPFVADEKDVFQGTTDSEGRTDVFAFDAPLNPNRWRLRPRVGSGPYGEQFVLRQSHDNSVLDKFPYLLLVCDDPPVTHRGYTDAEGQTAYVASNKPVSISVFVLGDDHLPTKAQIRAACRNS